MTPDEIGVELYDELADASLSATGISYWLRTNVGKLNNAINTTFNTPSGGNINLYHTVNSVTVDMQDEEKDIFKMLYEIYYYGKQIRSSMGAASVDPIIEISSDGATVRKINKNEMSKTWLTYRNNAYESLRNAIYAYTYGKSSAQQVYGDDISSIDSV